MLLWVKLVLYETKSAMDSQKSMADFASYRARCAILKTINSTPKQILLQRGFQRGNLTLYEAKSAMDFGQ